jgi:hypothetical protein
MAQLAYRETGMSLAVTLMQTLSAFVIFVAGYLVVLVAAICVVVLASGIYKGGQLVKAYTVRIACQPSAEDGRHQRAGVQRWVSKGCLPMVRRHSMRSSTKCVICGETLASQREKDLRICFSCRRYGLLNGLRPSKTIPSIFEVATYVSFDESAESNSILQLGNAQHSGKTDGETFGRRYTDHDKAAGFANRKKKSTLVKMARVIRVS